MIFYEQWMDYFKEGLNDGIKAAEIGNPEGPAIVFLRKYPDEIRSTPTKVYCEAYVFGKRKAHIFKQKKDYIRFLSQYGYLVKDGKKRILKTD